MYGDAHWIAAANYTGPKRFRQCGVCRGACELPDHDTWDSDAIANSTTCGACGGTGGEYFPLHALSYDVLPQLAKARAKYLRDRYDTSPVVPGYAVGLWPAKCEHAAQEYGKARAKAVSPVYLPHLDSIRLQEAA